MLPQHGGVPDFRLRFPGPLLLLLALVLVTGLMLSLSSHLHTDPGDLAAQNLVKLSTTITLLVSFLILLAGMGRRLHPHLWKQSNTPKKHCRRGHRRRRSGYSRHSR